MTRDPGDSGAALSTVRDVDFDGGGSGAITAVELEDAGTIASERIIGVGSYGRTCCQVADSSVIRARRH